MATPQKVPGPGPTLVIKIYGDEEAQEIYVDHEPFYVHPFLNERVQWVCQVKHRDNSHGPDCFTVDFPSGQKSPFCGKQFRNGETTDHEFPKSSVPYDRFFKYTITVRGIKDPLDPQGAVRP